MADFKAASSAISDLKVGSTAVQKVYAGADLVWSPAASGDRYTVTGNLATYNSTRFSVSSRTEGGSDTDWWSAYGFGEFRKNSDSQLTWTLLRESSGNPYATAGAFLAAFAAGTITLVVDGTAVSYSSVRLNGANSNNLQIIFEGSGYNTLWSGFSVGDSVSLTLNYSAQTAADWDDYDDGVFYSRRRVAYTSGQIDQLSASSSYSAIGRQDTISSGFRHWNAAGDAYLSSGFAPFIAIWDFSEWKVYKWNGTTGSGNRYFHWYGNGSTNVTNDPGPNRRVIVYLTQDPGTQNGFRDYDGPTDYMVYEDGMVAYEQFGTTWTSSSYIYPEEVAYSDAYDVPRRYRTRTSSVVQIQRVDNSVNSGLLTDHPPYIALWWERTGTSAERDWFIASYSGSNGEYNFVRSKSGVTAFHAPTNMSNEFVIVSLTADPGTGISNWSDYGDEKTPWESQETTISSWSSANNWWNITANTSWTRGGTLFADAKYIKLSGGKLQIRLEAGSFVSDLQDYIDEYATPEVWVWINGNKYVFDTFNQVTGSGDLLLDGPTMSQSDFEDGGSGSNTDGWTAGAGVKIEFRPQWDTFYPRTALAAGQTSPAAGQVNVQWEDWSSAFNYSSSMVNSSSGDHPIGTFIRGSLTGMQFRTSGSSYNTYNADSNGIKWFAFKRGTIAWDKGSNIEYGSSKTDLKATCIYGTLDYNSFATSPIGCLMTSRDPGPVYMWSDYDGPLYDWDSYAVQTFVDSALNTSASESERFPLTETMGSGTALVATIHGSGLIGYSNPQDRCLQSGYQNRGTNYSTLPGHHFYHNHSSLVGTGGYSYSSGWHAFGKSTDSSHQTGNGEIPFNIKEFTTDPVTGGWRGPIGTRNTLVSSSEGGQKAGYWKPPFVNDDMQLAGVFSQMGSTYNCRSDAGASSNNPKIFMGRKYARLMTDVIEDTKNPGYMFLFSNNRILVQWSGTNAAANKTAFDNGRPSSTCTVRLRQGITSNHSVGLGTEYTYTGTWGTWNSTASVCTLSNGSTGAPTWTSEYGDGSWSPISFAFMIRIED